MAELSVHTSSSHTLLPHKDLFIDPPGSPLTTQELDNNIIDLEKASPLAPDTYEQLYLEAFDVQSFNHSPPRLSSV